MDKVRWPKGWARITASFWKDSLFAGLRNKARSELLILKPVIHLVGRDQKPDRYSTWDVQINGFLCRFFKLNRLHVIDGVCYWRCRIATHRLQDRDFLLFELCRKNGRSKFLVVPVAALPPSDHRLKHICIPASGFSRRTFRKPIFNWLDWQDRFDLFRGMELERLKDSLDEGPVAS